MGDSTGGLKSDVDGQPHVWAGEHRISRERADRQVN